MRLLDVEHAPATVDIDHAPVTIDVDHAPARCREKPGSVVSFRYMLERPAFGFLLEGGGAE